MNIKPSGFTPQAIRNAIFAAGINQAAIARTLKVSPSHISAVIDGRGISRRVHKAISEAIGVDVKEIWPEIYLIPGREPKMGRPKKEWWRNKAA